MLPKKRRIQRSQFSSILSAGKRYTTPHLLAYVALQSEKMSAESQFSFSVSKKVCKLAVDRNRFRRRGYSTINTYLSRINPGFLIFFSFKKGSEGISFDTLYAEVSDILSRVGILK